ncbi:MAG: cell wall-active antibiotics response protein LiaF [Bellilinea sp.]
METQMWSRGIMVIGIFLIVMGILALISNLTGINFSSFCFPTSLILLGVLVLLRPRMVKEGTRVDFMLLGEYKRSGLWAVEPAEIWSGIGEVKLDFTQAEIPTGETTIRIYHFVGDVVLRPGAAMGLMLSANGMLNTVKWMGARQDNFLNALQLSTPNYDQAERKVKVDVTNFVGDIKGISPTDMA